MLAQARWAMGVGGVGRSARMWPCLSHYHVLIVGTSSPSLRHRHRLPPSPSPFPPPLSGCTTRFFHCRASSNAMSQPPMGQFNRFLILVVSNGGIGGNGDFSAFSGAGGGDKEAGSSGSSSNDSILSWYLNKLEKHPTLAKAWTSALLAFIGDLICQLLIDHAVTLDLKRTFVFTFLGFSLVGPTLHFLYFFLSKLVTIPGASGALLRLLLDQVLFSPTFIGVFLASLVTLEGRPSEEWFSSVIANWQLWIPFQFVNFQFVPQQFQVLAANLIALVWNVILSFKAHREIQPKSTE